MNKSTCNNRKENKGSLAITLVFVFILIVLSAAFLIRGVNESHLAQRVASSSAALWAAEAGLQKVLWEYNYNSCNNMTHADSQTGCNGDKSLAGTLNSYGDYDVSLDSSNTTVLSVGSIPSRTASNKIQRKVKGTLAKPAIFGYGMFAKGQVILKQNSLVDAYNSKLGPYGGTNIDHINGNVGSNGTTAGIVEVDNNATVWGNVSTGPGGTVTDNGSIHGSITDTNSIALPSVVVPPVLTALSSAGTLTVGNNGSTTIYGGDHKYSSISLGNQSTLTIDGYVRLYLTGDAAQTAINTGTAHVNIDILAGSTLIIYTDGTIIFDNNTNINSVAKNPKDLQIYSTYSGSNGISISNNSSTYAAVYAPQTDVDMSNNAGLYGAVVGKTTTLVNNGDVHYDVALGEMANPFDNFIISNWQEYQ